MNNKSTKLTIFLALFCSCRDRQLYTTAQIPEGYGPKPDMAISRVVGLCELARSVTWVTIGSVTSANYPSRTIQLRSGVGLEATDVTFKTRVNVLGDMPETALVRDRSSKEGMSVSGRLFDERGGERLGLFFFHYEESKPLLGKNAIFYPTDGVYHFPSPLADDIEEVVPETELATRIKFYREAHACSNENVAWQRIPTPTPTGDERARAIGETP